MGLADAGLVNKMRNPAKLGSIDITEGVNQVYIPAAISEIRSIKKA